MEVVDVDAAIALGDLPALLTRLAETERARDRQRSSASFRDKAAETREQAERLRQLLLNINQ